MCAVTKGNAAGAPSTGFYATNLVGDALVPSPARVVSASFDLTSDAGCYNVVPTTAYQHEGRYFLRIFTSGRASVKPIGRRSQSK